MSDEWIDGVRTRGEALATRIKEASVAGANQADLVGMFFDGIGEMLVPFVDSLDAAIARDIEAEREDARHEEALAARRRADELDETCRQWREGDAP